MKKTVNIPEGVSIQLTDSTITIKGEKGELKRDFFHSRIKCSINKEVTFESKKETRRDKRVMNTFASHVRNMIKGVTEGFTVSMRAVYSHFPMNMKVEETAFIINNFIGEQHPRRAKINEGVNVEVSGQEIKITGIDLEKVSQTAANIEKATMIRKKDRRIFQDGIYVVKKAKEE
jgi:large subunit ribosomal protein L6